jgi:hypothetical protein
VVTSAKPAVDDRQTAFSNEFTDLEIADSDFGRRGGNWRLFD